LEFGYLNITITKEVAMKGRDVLRSTTEISILNAMKLGVTRGNVSLLFCGCN
jgi:hypothetical protein